jgi:hypothetical protein
VSVLYSDPRDPGVGIETFPLTTDAPAYRPTGTGTLPIEISTFGTTDRLVSGLPARAAIPLLASLPILAFGLCALGWIRRHASGGAAYVFGASPQSAAALHR